MAKGPMYVKDFNFSSAGKTVGRCNDSMTKMASGGYYSKGGMKEPATGEMYPSRRAMMKHESMETPRMQRDEVMQSRTVKAPMRRQMPVAPTAPMIQPGGMKKGGFVKGGTGMVKTEGTLGIKGNKNPGESNGKPTTATKKGNVAFKKGGEVKKYADGGPAAPIEKTPLTIQGQQQAGALNQMAAQQRLTPSQIARQQAMAAQAAGKPMSQAQQQAGLQQAMTASQQPGYNPNMQQQNLSGAPLGQLGQQLTPSQIARQQAMAAQAAGQPMSQAQQQANLQGAMSNSQMMQQQSQLDAQALAGRQAMPAGRQIMPPTQTMLAGSQPMPPGVGAPMQMTPQMQQQMMAQFEAARSGQGMPGGQQAPQGLGQAMGGQPLGPAPAGATPPPGYGFGNSQNAPPQAPPAQMAAYQQQRMGQPLGVAQPMPTQQGMQQQSQFNGGGIGQYGGAVGQMGMGMGKFP